MSDPEQRILDELAQLRRTVADLQARVEGRTPAAEAAALRVADRQPTPAPMAADGSPRHSRRRLLGAAAAGSAAAVGAALWSEPAAATVGAMQFGATNNAGSDATTLVSGSSLWALKVQDTGKGNGLEASADDGNAVRATVTGSGTGVNATVSSGTAVNATASSGSAVRAVSASGAAGWFTATASGYPVVANSSQLATAGQILLAVNDTNRPAPVGDSVAHYVGELFRDGPGALWYCTASGTPGTWRKLSGSGTAGALHVLAAPVRVYDSRVGTTPAVGSKTPLSPNVARVVDLATSGAVPAGATAALVTCLIVDAPAGSGNFVIWANGVAKPFANSLVWGGTDGRASTLALTAVDATAKVQVASNLAINLALDVVAYYR